ncbi:hypothetical protein S245_000660 [Arachis hypogaea]
MLLTGIDFSSNHLTGEIPKEIELLFGLVLLNLLRNSLNDEIISNTGNLQSLEFLDLSRNHLSGKIPSSLSKIDRLAMLDLSNNDLDGKIPIGTQLESFDPATYEENPNLYGEPLNKKLRSLKPTYTQFPFGTRACSARTTIFIYATAFVSCLLSLCPLLFNLFFLIPLFHSFMCLKLEYNHHVNYICFVLTYNAYNYITFGRKTKTAPSRASLIETPVLWLGRLCIFYALLKAGLAGSHANPLVSELKISDGNDSADLGFSKWTHAILEKPETKR